MSRTAGRRVVVLDRDGTIMIDRDYLDDPAQLEFLPQAAQGLRLLHERGHRLVVITNQSGVGRGRFSLARLQEINARFIAMVERAGARIAGLYYCPHRPDEDCACRKPRTKLLEDAAAELGFAAADAVVIGDKASDVEFGRRAGALTMLVSPNGLTREGTPSTADQLPVTAASFNAASAVCGSGAASSIGRPASDRAKSRKT